MFSQKKKEAKKKKKKKEEEEEGKKKRRAGSRGVHPSRSDNTQSASVGCVDVRVRATVGPTVLFTSGAAAHYNGVNEEQM